MNKRLKLLTIFIVLLLATTGISFAEGSPLENDISVEQYIYSLMNTLSIEPADQEATGMEKYSKEAEVRWWIDMDTPQSLTRPLEKHEMIDMAVKAIREKGDVEYGTPSEIHEMVKDFEEVPYRSRISAVIGVNMGLVQLDENGKLSPLETVSVNEASQFLMKVKEAYTNYPNYEYLTELYEYEMYHHGYAQCLLDGSEYGSNKVSSAWYSGAIWNGLHHLEDFTWYYDDLGITFTTLDLPEKGKVHKETLISVYKPGPVLYIRRENGEIVERNLNLDEVDEEITEKRLNMVRQFAKEYFPENHLSILMERLEKHTSQPYIYDEAEFTEKIVIDNMYYCFSHYMSSVYLTGCDVKYVSERHLKVSKVVNSND